jgi:O-acetylserine/cysteine efflux transporter
MPIRAILAAILAVSCFGLNYTATKLALVDLPPLVILSIRFLAITIILAPFALRQPRPNIRQMALFGLVALVLQFALSFVALDMGLSITSGVIAAQLSVPFACIMSAILFKDYLGPWRSLGMMLAFLGVVMVAGTPNASEHWVAFALSVLASFAYAGGNLYLKTIRPSPTPVALLFWPALFVTPAFALLSLMFENGQWEAISHASPTSWLGVCYSIFIASLVGHTIWNTLVTRYPLSHVVPYSLLIPVAGIMGGVVAFDDPLTTQVLIGAVLTIAGVGVITLRRPQLAEVER